MSEFFVSEREADQIRADLNAGRTAQSSNGPGVFGLDVFRAPSRGAMRASLQVQDYINSGQQWTYEQLGWSTENLERGRARTQRLIRQYAPNPQTDSYAAQVLNSVSNVLTLAAAGQVTGGTGAAAGVTGVITGEDARRTLIDAGVRPEHAAMGAVIEGSTMGLGVLLPAAVPVRSLLLRSLSGAAINVGTGAAYRGGMSAYLNATGYPEVAERYQWLDPTAITIDALLGAGFGAMAPGPGPRRGASDAAPVEGGEPSGLSPDAENAYRGSIAARASDNLDEAYAQALLARELGHPEANELLARLEEEGGPDVVERGRALAEARKAVPGDAGALPRAAAIHQANAIHREIQSAPGIPASTRAQRAHARAMRKAEQQAEFDDTIEVRQMFAEALAMRTPADQPRTLTQFVRQQGEVRDDKNRIVRRGGIKDDAGDIAGSSGDALRGFASLLSPTGRPLDDVALAAWEAGYFPEFAERPTTRAFIDALDAEARGEPRYSTDDAELIEGLDTRAQFEREFDERGIDINAADDVLLRQIREVYADGNFVPHPASWTNDAEIDAIGEVIREQGGDEAFREWEDGVEEARRSGAALDPRDMEFSFGTGKPAPRGTFRAAMILHAEAAGPEEAAAMLGVNAQQYRQAVADSRLRASKLRAEGLSDEAIAARFGVDTEVVAALFDDALKYRRASTDRFIELYNAKDENGGRLYSAEQVAEMTGLKDQASVNATASALRRRGLRVERHGVVGRLEGDVESGLAREIAEAYLESGEYTAVARDLNERRGTDLDRKGVKRRLDAFLQAIREGAQEPITTDKQRAAQWWQVVQAFHEGLSGQEIVDATQGQFPDVSPEYVSSILTKRRRTAQQAARNGTLDLLALKWGVRPQVLETLADASQRFRHRASPQLLNVVRLSQKQPDDSYLSNGTIAERLRTMGFENATPKSVSVYQNKARNLGFEVPFRRGDPNRPAPERAYQRDIMQVRGTLVEINATSYEAARILADQRRMAQRQAVRWMVGPDGVTYAWDASAVWHADVALALGRQLDDFDKGVAHNAEELGEFDRARRDRRPLASRGVRGLFSVLERTVEQSNTEQASGEQWAATLRQAAGIKKEELSWTGVLDWLTLQPGAVRKQDVLHYLEEHGVRVMETVKSDESLLTEAQQTEYLDLVEEKDRLEAERAALMERDQGQADRGQRAWLPLDSIAVQLGFDGWGRLTPEQQAQVEAAFDAQPGRARYNEIQDRLADVAGQIVRFEQMNDVHRSERTRWSSLQTPGGERYREILLTLPARLPDVEVNLEYSEPLEISARRGNSDVVEPAREILVMEAGLHVGSIIEWTTAGPLGAWELRFADIAAPFFSQGDARATLERTWFKQKLREGMRQAEFRSSHWAESNVLAHIRINDRTDVNGRRVLFIDETQSDWMQRGRRYGFRDDPSNEAQLRARKVEINEAREALAADRNPVTNVMRNEAGWHELTNELRDIDAELGGLARRVAPGPFRKTWPLLTLKRMVRWAAEGGYDVIAWTTGDVQVKRYPRHLGETEAAGMRAFYDRNLVNIANDLGKKHGAQVSDLRVRAGEPQYTEMRIAHDGQRYWVEGRDREDGQVKRVSEYADDVMEASRRRDELTEAADVVAHAMPITPELRAAALDGLPLFSARREGVAGSSKAELEATLAREFGQDWQRLADAGRVEIHSNPLDLDTGAALPFSVKALHSRRDGKVYLFADNIAAPEARGLMLHEVGVHYGMREFLGVRGFAQLMRDVQGLVDAQNPAALEARALAEANALDRSQVPEETLAYLVEQAPHLPLVRRILARIREWIWRTFGRRFGQTLTPDDIATMAAASLRRAARQNARRRAPFVLDGELLASKGVDSLYSPLLRAIEQISTARASAQQWKATLARAPGVKKAEVEWLGLNEWLDLQGDKPIERDAIADFVRANGVRLDEVVLRADLPPEVTAEHANSIRELTEELARTRVSIAKVRREINADPTFKTFPSLADKNRVDTRAKIDELYNNVYLKQPLAQRLAHLEQVENNLQAMLLTLKGGPNGQTLYAEHILAGGSGYREIIVTMPNAPRKYETSHFDYDNILGWARVDERKDVDGRRLLFIQEIQSDWGQDGRKRGFGPLRVSAPRVERSKDHSGLWQIVVDIDGQTRGVQGRPLFKERARAEVELADPAVRSAIKRMTQKHLAPPMPFQTTWPTLVLKRIIREAVEGGYDAIAWTTGDMQVARFQLDRRGIRDIRWNPEDEALEYRTKPRGRAVSDIVDSFEDLVGKLGEETATALRNAPRDARGYHRITFEQPTDFLAHGMRAFYDKMIPNAVADLGKKFGGKLEEAAIVVPGSKKAPQTIETVRALPITEAMRSTIETQGLPMFAASDDARGARGRSTRESAEQEVKAMFGGDSAVMDAGFINVVQSANEVPVKGGVPDHVGALFDPDSRKVYLIAPRIRQGNVRRFVFHELGVHFGMREMLGTRAFNTLLQRVERLASRDGNAVAAAALRDARRFSSSPESIPEETLAYWVERVLDGRADATSRGMLEEFFSAVRAWLVRTFPELVNITDADVRELALSSLRRTREQARRQLLSERAKELDIPSPAHDALSEDPSMRVPDELGQVEPAGAQLNHARLGERTADKEAAGIEAAARCAARHGMTTAARPISFVTARAGAGAADAVSSGHIWGMTAGIPVGWAASHLVKRSADPETYYREQAGIHARRAEYAMERAREHAGALGSNDDRFPVSGTSSVPPDAYGAVWPSLWDYPEPREGPPGGGYTPEGARVSPAPAAAPSSGEPIQ